LFFFCQGSLVDDESVIEVLNVTKTTAAEVSEKLTVAADTEVKINVAREEFRPSQPPVTCLFFIADFLEVGLNSFIYTLTQALKLIPYRIFFSRVCIGKSVILQYSLYVNLFVYSTYTGIVLKRLQFCITKNGTL